MSVWLVTGASRGFGAEIVREALARGHQVVAAARNIEGIDSAFPDAGENLLPVSLDVTDERQAEAAVEAAKAAFGRIDVLVNNAGRGLLGAVEEADDDEVRSVFETNVFGLLAVTRAVAPVLRAQRSGTIVNLSSVAGFVGNPGWGVYAATKFAVEGLSEALHGELAPLGIEVLIVEPGYFRTDFLDSTSLHATASAIEDYTDGPVGAVRTRAATVNHRQPGDPVKAAKAIVDVVESGKTPLRIQLGSDSIAAVENKLGRVRQELDLWRDVSAGTDHADAGTTR
jgi:NAD(P)-dependent dehydrogenase (short-subunit alcohol dehydrogenase family)